QEIRHSRIHRRTIRRGIESNSRAVFTAGRSLQEARHRDAHRNKSRLAFRSHPESLWRHAAWNGGKRARVRADRARPELSRFHFFDESEQSKNYDRGVSAACRAIERAWAGLELSAASRRDRGGRRRRRPDQKRDRNRLAAGLPEWGHKLPVAPLGQPA